MRIGSLDTDQRILIIAEIGNNHEGDVAVAQEMIARAAEAGADAVKFQTIVPERFVRPSQRERMAQLKRFAFSYDQFAHLKAVADTHGVLFLSTPFDLESATFLNTIVPAFKIASGDNNFFPLLEHVAAMGKPIILSTGFAALPQIRQSVQAIEAIWDARGVRSHLALLHCVSSYPVDPAQANLRAIATLQREFPDRVIGYSDHTMGVRAAIAAVALGARIVEKHFTLDHHYSDFHDHQLSADPDELQAMVTEIRALEPMLGSGEKQPQSGEAAAMCASRRSIVAARDLPAGHVVTAADMTWMRPGDGLPPGCEQQLLGSVLRESVSVGEAITLGHILPVDVSVAAESV